MHINRRGTLGSLGILSLAACTASSALAQSQSHTRDGFVASAGAGVGSAQVTCAECGADRQSGPAGYLRLGVALRPNLILSGELNAWTKSNDVRYSNVDINGGVTEIRGTGRLTNATFNAVAQWYPQPTGGFFVDAGLGVGRYESRYDSPSVANFSAHTTALGYQLGAGYDLPLSGRLSLTPFATYFGIARASMPDVPMKVGANVGQIGLGLTWH